MGFYPPIFFGSLYRSYAAELEGGGLITSNDPFFVLPLYFVLWVSLRVGLFVKLLGFLLFCRVCGCLSVYFSYSTKLFFNESKHSKKKKKERSPNGKYKGANGSHYFPIIQSYLSIWVKDLKSSSLS